MPWAYLRVAFIGKKVLKEENEFTKAYGYLIDGIRVERQSQRLFYVFFMLRRIIYLGLAFDYPNLPSGV